MAHKILVVEDDQDVRQATCRYLLRSGFDVCSAATASSGEHAFRAERPDAAVLDYSLPDGDALRLLPRMQVLGRDIPILILTGYGSIDLAVRAIKHGAVDFLTKPMQPAELVGLLRQRLREREGPSPDAAPPVDPFFGTSPAVANLTADAGLALRTRGPVLVQGETGSGKGVLARWLHGGGPRAKGPFVALNCSGLAAELLHSELFGHKRGSFTGASEDKKGLLELADGGTLFLDEIGDVERQLQPRLLTVLEDKTFRRLGGLRERSVDMRLIAAANQDLSELVTQGGFRADLYFRPSTIVLRIPPLRERLEDLPILARRMLGQVISPTADATQLTDEAAAALAEHPWPGNFRELRNVLERAALAADGEPIRRHHLRFEHTLTPQGPPVPVPGRAPTLSELEGEHIREALRQERGNVVRTASRLGVARSTLYEKFRALRIDPADHRW